MMQHTMPPSNDSGFHELGKSFLLHTVASFETNHKLQTNFWYIILVESPSMKMEPAVDEYVSQFSTY